MFICAGPGSLFVMSRTGAHNRFYNIFKISRLRVGPYLELQLGGGGGGGFHESKGGFQDLVMVP